MTPVKAVTEFLAVGVKTSRIAQILSSLAEKALLGYNPVNDRIITTRFKTTVGCMTICQVYAPTTNADDKEMASFYDKLQEIIVRVYTEKRYDMGDFNAKVGQSDRAQMEW